MFLFHPRVELGEHAAHSLRVIHGVVFQHHLDTRLGGGETHRMRVVSQAAVEDVLVEIGSDPVADRNRAEG